jgi:hypothetical protein
MVRIPFLWFNNRDPDPIDQGASVPRIDENYEYACLNPLFESLRLLAWFNEGNETDTIKGAVEIEYWRDFSFVLTDERGCQHSMTLPSCPYVAANFLSRIGLGSFDGLLKKIEGASYFRVIRHEGGLSFRVEGSEL